MNEVRFVFCIHNHQPVGNLPEVFEDAYRRAYLPMLEIIEGHPEVNVVLHNSGPLLEWYELHAPDYIERVRKLVERGQAEILTGAFYEPILSSIPERDALGQIAMMSDYIADRFGTGPRGMWLAERVWEPGLARTIGQAGVEYLPLDDYEFRLAGVEDEDLVGPFLTDDRGVGVSVFPISKRLRYAIPFAEPEETLSLLHSIAERGKGLVAVFGDDGEKFGIWPGTHKHVYSGGWLERFFSALKKNDDWIRTTTLSEACDGVPARGRVYLPTSSYPEMMEWALPTPARRSLEEFKRKLNDDGLEETWGPFVSGGTWRGFLSKYQEANLMVRKMLRVSEKIERFVKAADRLCSQDESTAFRESVDARLARLDAAAIKEARRELWRGQCNCAYWHGIFGGLYLPHLRSAVYEHLIKAERLLDAGREDAWSDVEILDHDMDGRDEVVLESHCANVYVSPARGGAIFELDVKKADWNVLATMSHYLEAYYREIPEEVTEHVEVASSNSAVKSIHAGMTVKERGLSRLARGDAHPRWAAIDHFIGPDTECTARKWRDTEWADIERGDFAWSPYLFEGAIRESAVGVTMRRLGTVTDGTRDCGVELLKSVWLDSEGTVRVEYEITPELDIDLVFAPEWNLAFLTGAPEWVSMCGGDGKKLDLRETLTLDGVNTLEIADRIRGQRLGIGCRPSATMWTRPLETASQSEGGLERVFQGLNVVILWPVNAHRGQRSCFGVTIRSSPEQK
ncbi:MAG: DUF1926 domain-containing protein [Candidatus Eisenbacteria bacterium]|nr:DUF1926 domain-containing protein [Candidatus Eisenbacteria bacterium]